MQVLLTTIAGLVGIFVPLFSIIVLNSKSDISQAFLTDEQKLKVYYYNLFMLSLLLGTLGAVIYIMLIPIFAESTYSLNPTILGKAISIAIVIFLLSIMFIGTLAKVIQVKYFKTHYKFKVTLPNIGEVYIIRMLTSEICICSEYPNFEYKNSGKKSYLIPLNIIIQQPLIKKEIKKPKQTLRKILFE